LASQSGIVSLVHFILPLMSMYEQSMKVSAAIDVYDGARNEAGRRTAQECKGGGNFIGIGKALLGIIGRIIALSPRHWRVGCSGRHRIDVDQVSGHVLCEPAQESMYAAFRGGIMRSAPDAASKSRHGT